MLTVTRADNTVISDYYEAVIDRGGTPVLIESDTTSLRLIRLSLLSASSEGENLYVSEILESYDDFIKPLIATLHLGSAFPRYGVSTDNGDYGIEAGKNDVIVFPVTTVPDEKQHLPQEK